MEEIKHQFLLRLITVKEAIEKLVVIGYGELMATKIVRYWESER